MDKALEVFSGLVVALGPVGAAMLVLLLVVLFMYRLDFLRRVKGLKEAHARRDTRDDLMMKIVQDNARVNESMAGALRELKESIQRNEQVTDRSMTLLADAIRSRG